MCVHAATCVYMCVFQMIVLDNEISIAEGATELIQMYTCSVIIGTASLQRATELIQVCVHGAYMCVFEVIA